MASNWKNRDTSRVKPKHDPYKREKSYNIKKETTREEIVKRKNPAVYQQDQLTIVEGGGGGEELSYFDEVLDKMNRENEDDDIHL